MERLRGGAYGMGGIGICASGGRDVPHAGLEEDDDEISYRGHVQHRGPFGAFLGPAPEGRALSRFVPVILVECADLEKEREPVDEMLGFAHGFPRLGALHPVAVDGTTYVFLVLSTQDAILGQA